MKIMFASDIHGSYPSCAQMMKRFDEEKAQRLILLGDLLYHGPRNDLPTGYSPKETARILNERKNILFCVKGNCDSEVDGMVLEFPIMAEYALIWLDGRTVFVTHGDKYNKENPPLIGKNDILIHGHTHVSTIDASGDFVYLNPGSVSLPKEGSEKSYMIYEDGIFSLKNLLTAEIVEKYAIK
ncbi:MAG: phosphodiesterase [Oscillospiraceae bacterium]|nr:phosphodiesterase [Oscillospiraceae bacterium]